MRAAKTAGLRFKGKYFALAELRSKVEPQLVANLGDVAIAAFLVLQGRVDKYGSDVVWVSRDTLAEMAGGKNNRSARLTLRSLKRALKRLKLATFIEDTGTARRGHVQQRKLLVSAELTSSKTIAFDLSPTVAAKLQELPVWGGFRETILVPRQAPQAQQVGPPNLGVKTVPQEEQDGTPCISKTVPHAKPRRSPMHEEEEKACNPLNELGNSVETGVEFGGKTVPPTLVTTQLLETASLGIDQLLLTEKIVGSAKKPASPLPPFSFVEGAQEPTPKFKHGLATVEGLAELTAWRKLHPRAPPIVFGRNGFPPFPAPEEVGYMIPGPPKIPVYLEDDREACLTWVAMWYRSAIESRGVVCERIRMSGYTRKYFEDATDIFIEHKIRPGGWVAWALDRMMKRLPANAAKRTRYSVKHLLSTKTLTEFRWAYDEEAALHYSTKEFVVTDFGKDLWRRLNTAHLEALSLNTADSAKIFAVVQKYFPEGFNAARVQAREIAVAKSKEVLEDIRLGYWLWPVPK